MADRGRVGKFPQKADNAEGGQQAKLGDFDVGLAEIQTDRQHSRKISKDKLLSLSKLARAFWEKHPSQIRRASSGQYGRAHTRGHILPRAQPSVWQNDPAISRSSGFWRSSSKSRIANSFESLSQFSRSVSIVCSSS